MRVIRLLLVLAIALAVPIASATAARATVTGPCAASGTIAGTRYPASRAKVVIPRAGDVRWQGAVTPGSGTRDIEGKVYLELPPPIGRVLLGGGWHGPSSRRANQGTYHYDLPALLQGMRITLSGHHSERGSVVCTGTIEVRIAGSRLKNPLLLASLVLTALALFNMSFVVRAKQARL